MSFLKPQGPQTLPGVNPMAEKLGRLVGEDPGRVSSVADRIGNGMNMIASAGGAQPGYARPAGYQPQEAAPQGDTSNHLQLLDPDILQALVARFRPTSRGVQY